MLPSALLDHVLTGTAIPQNIRMEKHLRFCLCGLVSALKDPLVLIAVTA